MISVNVKCGKDEWKVVTCKGKTLSEVLQENNIKIHNICHGNGSCGKCKIKVSPATLPITDAERRMLSQAELEQGIRLACKVRLEGLKVMGKEALGEKDKDSVRVKDRDSVKDAEEQEELCIELVGENEENISVQGISMQKIVRQMEPLTEQSTNQMNEQRMEPLTEQSTNRMNEQRMEPLTEQMEQTEKSVKKEETKIPYFIAIDIGTTTIAMVLVNEKNGEIEDSYTSLNHQRKYGADVISRILAAGNGKAEELKRLIEQDLWEGICKLAQRRKITQIIIAGNPTMIHLLMGYSCETLGKYPFVSGHLEQIECTWKDVIIINKMLKEDILITENCMYNELEDIPITILPGISAFVGGDIVAGILSCPGFETKEISLLIDLGTNGEMVLGDQEKLLATSTAAGPAFEGGNIVCGTASIPGSIDRVKVQNRKAVVKTIQNKMPPIGICGTGLVSAIAQLKQNKIMDIQGNMLYPYNENGFPLWVQNEGQSIKIYQKDIREFQMAKAAIRAGVEILMEEYECLAGEIKQVYLAGGFGTNVSAEDVIITGILPEEFRGKIVPIGNGALQGAIKVGLMHREVQNREKIRKAATHISLAEHQSFQKKYLKYLEF